MHFILYSPSKMEPTGIMILPILNQILYTNIDNFAYLIDLYLYPQNLLPVSELSIELVADATDATDDDVS